MINTREQKCPQMHEIRKRIIDFHELNETFYTSLSDSTQQYEHLIVIHISIFFVFRTLKSDGIDDCQKLKQKWEDLKKVGLY